MSDASDSLLEGMVAQARRLRLAVDGAVYREAGRDPRAPIAWAGQLTAGVCIVGRDLGRDEVRRGQPLVGASGRAVREGVLRAVGGWPAPGDALLETALAHVLLCNLVPYKPVGNRAFSADVLAAFRPSLEQLLGCRWSGNAVLALGNGALAWFEPYAEAEAYRSLAASPNRYEGELACRLEVVCGARSVARSFTVCPLPHPSPANATWRKRFPGLLEKRLAKWLGKSSPLTQKAPLPRNGRGLG